MARLSNGSGPGVICRAPPVEASWNSSPTTWQATVLDELQELESMGLLAKWAEDDRPGFASLPCHWAGLEFGERAR